MGIYKGNDGVRDVGWLELLVGGVDLFQYVSRISRRLQAS